MNVSGMEVELRGMLAALQPAGSVERMAVAAVLALLDEPDPFSSSSFEPGHITASAFVVHPTERSVALVLHSKLKRWLQPGGHVETSDTSIVAAAIREVAEEVGVGPADDPWLLDVDVHVFPERHDVPRHLHHDVRVAFTADSSRLRIGDGADDVRWWSFDDAIALEDSVARPVRKLQSTLRH
jgi:8-oxo-dGTP pyrophosphatase MutT (NUDIX family)